MIDNLTLESIDDPISYSIYYRANWADGWTQDENIYLVDLQYAMAPTMPRATLVRYFGIIETIGDNAGAAKVLPLDLTGKYIKIVLTQNSDTREWFGYCPDPVDNYEGTRVTDEITSGESVSTGKTTYNCYGMEWFLRDTVIKTSILNDGVNSNVVSERVYPYNFTQSTRDEVSAGNRSTDKNVVDIYEFHPTDGAIWSGLDVVEHLLKVWYVQTGAPFEFVLTESFAELVNIKGAWFFDSMNFYAAIQQIISPENAFGFSVSVNEITGNVEIEVIPTVSTDVAFGGGTIVTARGLTYVMDLDSDSRIDRDQCTLQYLSSNHYDKIEVRGDYLRVMFSVAVGDLPTGLLPTNWPRVLFEGWTEAQQTAYEAADDKARKRDTNKTVFSSFVIKDGWDGYTGPDSSVYCFPQVDTETGKVTIIGQQTFFLKNRVFDRVLPVGDLSDPSQPRTPFAVWIGADDKWNYLDTPEDPYTGLGLEVMDDKLGINIKFGNKLSHLIAENRFSGISDVDPEFDYTDMFVTLSMRSDERSRVIVDAPEPEAGEIERTKVIDLPQYGVAFICPYTILEINDGTQQSGLNLVGASGQYARDDSEYLLRAATLAKEIYGRRRQILSVNYASPNLDEMVGFFVSEVQAGETTQAVNTLITSQTYRFEEDAQSMIVKTSFPEPSLQKIVGRTAFKFGGGGSTYPDNLGRNPSRQPSSGTSNGSGSFSPYYFQATKLDDNTVTISNNRYRVGTTQGTVANENVTIPAVDGTYYIYFQIYYNSGYLVSIEVSDVNTHPDQDNIVIGNYPAFREEIAAVEVVDGIISSIAPIWNGSILSVEGRVV